MTPYEKTLQRKDDINYCDECEQFQIIGDAAFCKADGKLIHPLMMKRRQGFGPARNCDKHNKPITNADRIRSMTDEDMVIWILKNCCCEHCPVECIDFIPCHILIREWLKQEAD